MKIPLTNILLIALLLSSIIPLASCGQKEQSQPIGSVLEYFGVQDNRQFKITARVMNIGDDGIIQVSARIIPNDDGIVIGATTKDTKLYLEQGEEETIHFYFQLSNIFKYNAWSYKVWCPPL